MTDYFRLCFRDVDGHMAYVTSAPQVREELGLAQQFACFTTDILKAAAFEAEACAAVKNAVEAYYKELMPTPIHFTVDRVL